MIRLRYADLPLILHPLAVAPIDTLRLWHRRLKQRHELGRLDTTQMRDTGLNPEVIRREAAKPFWRA